MDFAGYFARAALIILIVAALLFLIHRTVRRRIEFIKERFYEPTNNPVDSDWGIKILYPSRPIEKCIILYNNTRLPWGDKDEPYYEKRIEKSGGGFVRIPNAIQKEGAKIRFKNGRKTLLKVKFNNLYMAKPMDSMQANVNNGHAG